MHFPGHNYLGPGTNDFTALPVDEDDVIAQRHDLAYLEAQHPEDIRQADREAISDFLHHGGLHSYIGAAGLALKYGVESMTGIVYPRKHFTEKTMPPAKRQRNGNEDVEDNKDEAPEIEVDTKQVPQTGSSMPGGTGSDVIATILENPGTTHASLIYRKAFQIYTAGFKFKVLDNHSWTSVFHNGTKMLCTPLVDISPNERSWFIDPMEDSIMPLNTWAKRCRIKVTPLGYRLPFATNEAASSFANSQTLVQIAYGVGLNKILNYVSTGVKVNVSDLTDISDFQTRENASKMLYGNDGADTDIPASVGIPRHYNSYISFPHSDATGKPSLLRYINIRNVNDCKGVPVIDYTYKYKCAPLKNADVSVREQAHFPILEGFTTALPTRLGGRYNAKSESSALSATSCIPYGRTKTQAFGYETILEKSQLMQRNVGDSNTPDAPPTLTFGVLPVQSNAALSPTATFANVVVQWYIETELEVEHSPVSIFPFANMPNIQAWDPNFCSADMLGAAWANNSCAYVAGRRTQGVVQQDLQQILTTNAPWQAASTSQ